jgi:hypothetical protein
MMLKFFRRNPLNDNIARVYGTIVAQAPGGTFLPGLFRSRQRSNLPSRAKKR